MAQLARTVPLEVGEHGVLVDGVDATVEIRTPEVTAAVSRVAANSAVRSELVERQRRWGIERGGGVIEGRDIGSVVFPDAELKLYLTASPRVRAERRVAEAGGDIDEIAAAITARDRFDSTRADSPLTETDDADRRRHHRAEHRRGARTDRRVAHRPMTKIDTTLAGNSRIERAAYQTVRAIVVGFCRTWCRMRVEGAHHVPAEGPFLLAPVHRSILDTPISSGVTRRRMRFMGADKYWKSRSFGRLLSTLGGFPVTRGSADREALQRCIAVLQRGEPLVLFPEGERKSGDAVHPLFEGATYIAVKAGVPIVPVGIGGSERAMPKGAKYIRPHKVRVVVGPPIAAPAGLTGKAQRDAIRELTKVLHAELQRLLDEAQRQAR